MEDRREGSAKPQQQDSGFEEGMDRKPDSPEEHHEGDFAEGMETLPQDMHQRRFSEGEEEVGDADEEAEQGDFATGMREDDEEERPAP